MNRYFYEKLEKTQIKYLQGETRREYAVVSELVVKKSGKITLEWRTGTKVNRWITDLDRAVEICNKYNERSIKNMDKMNPEYEYVNPDKPNQIIYRDIVISEPKVLELEIEL